MPQPSLSKFCFCLALLLGASAAPARAASASAETVVPLGPAQVSELSGEAWAMPANKTAGAARRSLRVGDRLGDGEQLQTGGTAHLELRFGDGTLLRVGASAALTALSQSRSVALHSGRVLVAGDRMLGGLAVLTRRAALLPEGTTYLAEVKGDGGELSVAVLEGALCACAVAPPVTQAAAKTAAAPSAALPSSHPEQMVLPGEALSVPSPSPPGAPKAPRPVPLPLGAQLKSEPLITAFSRPLPALRVIDDLADQQRRGVLAGRNERLRREIFWKRKPRAPLKLPALFSEPDSVIIRYEYPR